MSGLTATARSVPGTLRQEVVVAGKHLIVTDEPVQAGGDDRAAAPHELLPAALASCVSTTLVMFARRKRWDLGEVTVDVDYDHRATPRRCEVVIRVTAELSRAQLEILERVAATCPVRRALETGFVFEEALLAHSSPTAV